MKTNEKYLWLSPIKKCNNDTVVIYFPYAGGNSYDFEVLTKFIDMEIDFYSIQLPGRGRRIKEPPLTDVNFIVNNIIDELKQLNYKNLILFGYSFGALLAFEVCYLLQKKANVIGLLVAAMHPPHKVKYVDTEITYNLPDEEFIKNLNKMNIYPKEVLNNKELWDYMLPFIRADIQMCETYKMPFKKSINIPIICYYGSDDNIVPIENILNWSDLTNSNSKIQLINGGHFFIKSNIRSLSIHLATDILHLKKLSI